jgi:hypothetical protein
VESVQKPIEINLKRVPALVECCMRLHNFCVNERNLDWCVPDLPDHVVTEHNPQYEEYIDCLDNEGQNMRAGSRNNVRAKVRAAIKRQLAALGRDRPAYNKLRNKT